MRKNLKIILSTVVGLLSLGIATLVIAPFTVDVNDFKTQIIAAVEETTGRELTIAGEIEVSMFPWQGLTLNNLSVNNAEGFTEQTFAHIDKTQLKVKLLPLLSKQVEISEINLQGVNVNLHKNSQGLSNWDDLLALIHNPQNQAKNPLELLKMAAVSVAEGQIDWNNQQTGHIVTLKDFNLNTDKLVFNQTMEISFKFNGTDSQTALTEQLDFSGKMTINDNLDLFSFKQLKIETQTEGKTVPNGKLIATLLGNLDFNARQQVLKFNTLEIKTDKFAIAADTLTTQLQSPFKTEGSIHIPDFDAGEFLQQQAQIKLPLMADERALSWIAADFQLHADANHVKLNNLELQLDETAVTGTAQITDLAKPFLSFNLALDKINLDRYLPPTGKKDSFTVWSRQPRAASKENPEVLPIDIFKKLNLNGQLRVNDLKVSNLIMQGVRMLFNAQNGLLQSQQSVNRLYQGAYNSKITLDTNSETPILTLQQQLSHIQIEPLLTDLQGQSRFAGLIDLNAKLAATGKTNAELKSSLNGRLSILGKDMLIRGFNLQKIVDNGKILLNNSALATDDKKTHTTFTKINATAIINNGFLSNNDLSANVGKTKVGGMGVINLISQQLDYKIIALSLKEKITATQIKVLDNFPVFINISGSFDNPAYQVDLAAMGVGL